MEEKTNIEVTEADFESFEDGWDDETVAPDADDDLSPDEPEAEAAAADGEPVHEQDEAPAETEEPQTETEAEEKPADHSEQAEPNEPERFPLKHLDDRHNVTLEEMRVLASKGLDYDRVKGKIAEYEAFFSEISGGKTPVEVIEAVRAERLAKEQGISSADALERVRFARQKREFDTEKAESDKVKAAQQKRSADIAEFASQYPDVKAQDIPREVWADVNKGVSLTNAYARYENKSLKERVKALEAEKLAIQQNEKNKERTAGSRATAGKKQVSDPFDEGWGD